ncbi:MAG: Sirohydrochlorin cobaltochelatase [Acidimicrobiales bacterium]|nr:Sirohydrochlorin cobaltochelatase [Acidimicrobiales bacterium]
MSTAVVIVAHGSRADAANDAHRATVEALAALVPAPVTAAFLELAEPDIASAIHQAAEAGATDIVVLPFFLYPGRHVAEDIPAIVRAAGAELPGVAVRLLESFGADPVVLATLAAQVRVGLRPPSA